MFFYFKRCLPKSLLLAAYNNNNTHVGYIAHKYLLLACIMIFFPQNNTRCLFIKDKNNTNFRNHYCAGGLPVTHPIGNQ